MRQGLCGSMTIAIVLQGQLGYTSRVKGKTYRLFYLRHRPEGTLEFSSS